VILVPIGRDQTEVRRTPWVSYVIIAINVAVFILVNLGAERLHLAVLEAKHVELIKYIQAHPYLELPETVRPYFHESLPGEMAAERAARRADGTLPLAMTVQRQQSEMDRLAGDVVAMIHDLPTRRLGFVPSEPGFMSRISSIFVHADIFHLLGNLLFFFATGPFLEDVFGKPLFSALYLVSGLVATFAYQSQHPGSETYLIGASGAIAGVMGAYFLRFLRSRTQFLCIPFILLWRLSFRFFMPAYVVFPFWFAVQVMFAMSESEMETSTAFSAHVGGFVVGLFTTGMVRLFRVEEKYIDPSITSKISWSRNPLLDQADDARRSGNHRDALRRVAACIAAEPDNLDARLMACDIARESGDWENWSKSVTNLLDLYARRREPELAVQLIDESIRAGGAHLPTRFYMRAADLLARNPDERDWAKDLYGHVVGKDDHPATVVRALVRIAQLSRQTRDYDAARQALERARNHPGLDAEYAVAVDHEWNRLAEAMKG
jgi:membrane associated rhomboid family serine protease